MYKIPKNYATHACQQRFDNWADPVVYLIPLKSRNQVVLKTFSTLEHRDFYLRVGSSHETTVSMSVEALKQMGFVTGADQT